MNSIVIGSGFGGIAAALRLKAKGHKVTLVEKHSDLGGRARVFKRNGFTYDGGPTVITAPYLINELFELFKKDSKNYIHLSPLKIWYQFIFEDNSKFNYSGDEAEMKRQINELSKEDVKGYKKLVDLVCKLQKIKLNKYYFFKRKKIKFSRYSLYNLHKESDLFFDWYLKIFFKNKNLKEIKKTLKDELNNIYSKLYFKNNFFTHRDFHASNVMLNNGKLSVIDSQDAIIGNPLYDVASLIDDVRIKLHKNLQDNLFNYYVIQSQFYKKDLLHLKNDFDILSVQRNLKILGIFVRLHKRDGKSVYLKYLPYTWSLIERRMENPIFKKLNILMKKHLPMQKLKKYEN